MFNSSLVIQQILDQKLLVKVVFVGDHLDEVVDELEATQSKYLVNINPLLNNAKLCRCFTSLRRCLF